MGEYGNGRFGQAMWDVPLVPYSHIPKFFWKLSASRRIVKSCCGALFYSHLPLLTSEVLVRSYSQYVLPLVALSLSLNSCADQGPDPILPGVDCTASTPVQLNAGESVILSATVNNGCIRIPAAGGSGARHLIVAYSGAGSETQNGVSGPFAFSSQLVAAAAPPTLPELSRMEATNRAAQFHLGLRQREQRLANAPPQAANRTARIHRIPPVEGVQDTFKVCGDTDCADNTFVNVIATARFVGPKGAIYVDNTVPAGGLSPADIDSLGALFDGPSPNIYDIDTTAFGSTSDLDGNGVVIVLLTDAVNDLSGTCSDGSIILGYFFGLDLVSDPNSNNGEVFYGLVPDPTASNCAASKNFVFDNLPPVLIHELQHMISFNQHVLVRGGNGEQTWLNEALSHYAEELGGRQIQDARCPGFTSCLLQFTIGNLSNGFDYLTNPQTAFLVYPRSSFGTLRERGASWLFLRWLVDHEAADTLLGTDLTRSLVLTSAVGAANIAAVTGKAFDQLAGQWQMANYTERLGVFGDGTGRLRYRTWDFVATFNDLGASYPLNPDSVTTGTYASTGFLRGGSGKHVLVVQGANDQAIDLQLKGDNTFSSLVPRFAVVRIQ